MSSGKCNRGDFQIDWFSKTPALVNLRNVPCPDGHSCADGQTCCKLVDGKYGCCPIPNVIIIVISILKHKICFMSWLFTAI